MYLLFTHSRDEYCVDLVQAHLNESGFRSMIIYTDSYPFGFQTVYSPLDHKRWRSYRPNDRKWNMDSKMGWSRYV